MVEKGRDAHYIFALTFWFSDALPVPVLQVVQLRYGERCQVSRPERNIDARSFHL